MGAEMDKKSTKPIGRFTYCFVGILLLSFSLVLRPYPLKMDVDPFPEFFLIERCA
jgi:hypothetical protein